MRSQNGTTPKSHIGISHVGAVELVGAFLLQVARHERDGLSHSSAVLAAASTMGTDPGAVLRATEEGRA